ncbi:MAG TPA: hypothetical protein PK385_06580 [Spirochaetota bacterium]|nr:MAG: hypothetical protein BWX91_01672 [Spirochaetes bacterium ADurb.Bin133]HNZ26193.1 hypothetical protein [Spirochaetota bacterium]HOF01583.1 hypothetical protein [Spirochaetota bacterium]HOS32803.1 hypothetical protein [Spirochaetota bacterium]HOS55708.1 hypothetical protein [Spirochaetota bacterium]
MKKYFLVAAILNIFLLTSCSKNLMFNRQVNIKYREKNPLESIRVNSLKGDVDITGWSKDFVEIDTNKKIFTGLASDINLMDTVFYFDEVYKELNIKTKIPTRINGSIDIKIFVPFTLLKLYINSGEGDVTVNKHLGDIELVSSSGNNDIDFQGNILRINSYKTKTFLKVLSYSSSDIIINSEEGSLNSYIYSVGDASYLDIATLNVTVNLSISQDIDHKLIVKNKSKGINVKYDLDDPNSIQGTYNIFTGNYGKKYQEFIIDINSEGGAIDVSQIISKEPTERRFY